MKTPTILSATVHRLLLAALLLSAAVGSVAAATTRYLHPNGSFKPDNTRENPDKFIDYVQRLGFPGDVIAVAGTHKFTSANRLEKPRRWEKYGDGNARIEKVTPVASTTFTATHLNCHLTYCASFIANWQDPERAVEIAKASYGVAKGEIDFQGFCELWSEYYIGEHSDWAWNWYVNNVDYAFHPMSYGGYGNARSGNGGTDDIEHSGLAMRSVNPISGFTQHIYNQQAGYDRNSNKGWISGTITKQGIAIHVIVTHTQADDTSAARTARAGQLAQLQEYIRWYRSVNQHHAVIAMGDFNVVGDGRFPNNSYNVQSAEYPDFSQAMRSNGALAIDCAMHQPNGSQAYRFTFSTENQLMRWFYPTNSNGFRNESWNGRLDYFLCYDSQDDKVRVQPTDYAVVPLMSSYEITGYDCGNLIYWNQSFDLSDHYAIRGSFSLVEFP